MGLPNTAIRRPHPEDKQQSVVWKFTQITNGSGLAKEGSAMRHCVYSYKHRCVSGACSIRSLTSEDQAGKVARHLTVEVNQYGEIVQARGLANRPARPEERSVLKLWAQGRGLSLRGA